ncbi:uncharacterized protein LOC123552191 [Mercenaria mercenaria]|uniref:uncharacterized protein LOC123552191 n=1 Tax=Mercenaria mercenaria TaxID=6596 RepID=UPI00234E4E6E|nr:uncharacterized protein LOC123552191 [Mercenaria mercenaria]
MPSTRKRRYPDPPPIPSQPRVNTQSAQEDQSAVQQQTSASSSNLAQELVDNLVPQVTKGVLDVLVQMRVISSADIPHTDDSQVQSISPASTPAPPMMSGRSSHSIVPPTDQNAANTLQGNTPVRAISSTVPHLLLGIDSKLKSKIWADEYVDLGLLLMDTPEDTESFRFVESTAGTVTLQVIILRL